MESHVYVSMPLSPIRVECHRPDPRIHPDGAIRVWLGEYPDVWLALSPDDAEALSMQLRAALLQLENQLELAQPSTQGRLPIKD
jgi:hypothetical protein